MGQTTAGEDPSAAPPASAAHLLFHFFCNLLSSGDVTTTATIDSRLWFRFLSFIVSLVSLLLWFPLKIKLFIVVTMYKLRV